MKRIVMTILTTILATAALAVPVNHEGSDGVAALEVSRVAGPVWRSIPTYGRHWDAEQTFKGIKWEHMTYK